jgi:hypothetical protein
LLETPGFSDDMEHSIFAMYKWVLGDTDADAIEQADIGLAFIIFGVFTLLVTVLMVNVLVAMFNKYDDSFHHLPPAASSTTDRGHVRRFIHLTQPAPSARTSA